jgi:hypothetical protein
MSQRDQWQTHPSYSSMPGRQYCSILGADDSSTFVNPRHEGSSRLYSPYSFSPDTAIPPPPPGIDTTRVSQQKRNTGYHIALAVLTVLVVALCSLEVIQMAEHPPLTTNPSRSAGTNQAGTRSAQQAIAHQKTTPGRIVAPETIKENVTLTCGGCNDPVLSTLTSITIDTTNLRLLMTVALNNISGAQQIDYFAQFNLQDQFGTTYEGTGELNTNFFLRAGQRAIKSEIFSFLPRPSVSYTLIARLGISGITYDPLQLIF